MKIGLVETHNLAGLTDWMCQIKINNKRRQLIRDALDKEGIALLKEGFYLKQKVSETGFKTIERFIVLER